MIACRYLPIALSFSAALLLGACSRTQEASRTTAAEDVTEVKLIPPYESFLWPIRLSFLFPLPAISVKNMRCLKDWTMQAAQLLSR